jgi:phosphoglycerol transferase MdoB-like AlkP superfamily enzyme
MLDIRSSQPNKSTFDTPNLRLIIAYDVLYFIDFILVLLLIFTAWLSQIRRTSTWYAALSTTFVSATANLLLLGQQGRVGPSPGSHMCLVQAALIHSLVVLWVS